MLGMLMELFSWCRLGAPAWDTVTPGDEQAPSFKPWQVPAPVSKIPALPGDAGGCCKSSTNPLQLP